MAATADRRGAAAQSPATGASAARGAMVPPQGDDTLTRFLRDMALRLPLDRVVEAHVFPPIRQGGAETGVAVIAARRMETVAAEEAAAEEAAAARAAAVAGDDIGAAVAGDDIGAADASAAGGAPPHGEVANSDARGRHPSDAPDIESTQPDEATSHVRPLVSDLPERHTVFSARYRLTLKGPDRGKWEIDVVEEADAPLITVDAVVRGVQRRAGEASEPERFSAEQLRAVVAGATASDAGA